MDIADEQVPDLDRHTIRFTVKAATTELHAGDALIIRDVQQSREGLRVAAVSEKALKDEAAKVFK